MGWLLSKPPLRSYSLVKKHKPNFCCKPQFLKHLKHWNAAHCAGVCVSEKVVCVYVYTGECAKVFESVCSMLCCAGNKLTKILFQVFAKLFSKPSEHTHTHSLKHTHQHRDINDVWVVRLPSFGQVCRVVRCLPHKELIRIYGKIYMKCEKE